MLAGLAESQEPWRPGTQAWSVSPAEGLGLSVQVRHGATLGLAEVTLALHRVGSGLQDSRAAQVAGVVPAIEKARLYRGKGGEIMRSAVCRSAAALHEQPFITASSSHPFLVLISCSGLICNLGHVHMHKTCIH